MFNKGKKVTVSLFSYLFNYLFNYGEYNERQCVKEVFDEISRSMAMTD